MKLLGALSQSVCLITKPLIMNVVK